MPSVHLSVCLFCPFFWLNVDCTKHVYTFLKCINRTLSLQILPVSFQSSDWKQLSSTFFFLYSWFKYLMKLIITIMFFFYSLLALDKHGERISVSCLTFKYFGRWFNLKSSSNIFSLICNFFLLIASLSICICVLVFGPIFCWLIQCELFYCV